MNERQEKQQRFDLSGENLIVGQAANCPITPEQLAATTSQSAYVVDTFTSGLTAEVFHIRLGEKDYTLKKRRTVARVQNLDGQYSFLNEVQRRRDFQVLKDTPDTADKLRSIVNTIYADYRLGIILSEWIEGEPISEITPSLLSQLFTTLIETEKSGLFEWDLCAGNLLIDNHDQLKLFDFGYMYPFEPLTELNSNGMEDPLFHFCERFETRFFSGWLLEQEYTEAQSLECFRQVKQAASMALEQKLTWLVKNRSSHSVIEQTQALLSKYQHALDDEKALAQLYTVEMFRSHVLDIEDDLDGKSCTLTTIKRVEKVLSMIELNYQDLNQHGALFYHNQGKSQEELIYDYQGKLNLVKQYQL
ncbi:phosphotransferase [Vibrio sp. SCSIO 43136]|uniref:phosphotransferase n=1 Tax=Vibrio sp. SCSIO 43136 TaxID=2819101 RepID=UPI002076224F|nr:phosphotransferase [Vibrio sp. SCSIO 43136]USD67189.1 phosphotransferase [Vibrio sp. SCSIO 43136]